MLKTRIKTAIVLVIIFIPILWFSYNTYVVKGFEAVLSALAIWEMFRAGGILKKLWLTIPFELIACGLPFVTIPEYLMILTVIFPLALMMFLFIMLHINSEKVRNNIMPVVYGVIILVFCHSVSLLRAQSFGIAYFIAVIIAAIGTDTAAYFVGSHLGKHKLAPDVSPHKSLEGSLGGIAASALLMAVFGVVLQLCFKLQVNYTAAVLYAVAGSVVGQIGDLSMSTIKRIHGIKDYSNLLPGHGGILDRFDSVIFLVPYTLLFVLGVNGIII